MKPVLFGCEGFELSAAERAFFAEAQPFGFILFKRNCDTPKQVQQLIADLRACVKPDHRGQFAPVFVDQEGGRVARLKPPHWPSMPPMRPIGVLFERDPVKGVEAMRLHARITARVLRDLGFDGNCAPVLDLLLPITADAIGDRAFSDNPATIAALGKVAVETYLAHGVMPVIKHMPGHGRVLVDPHEKLPFVDADLALLREQDFKPFIALRDAPAAMNCHVVFRAIDADRPVSLSAKAHAEILRGEIGFEGFIFSDDIAMGALDGPLAERATGALTAGADIVVYCAGDLEGMREICAALPEMKQTSRDRWDAARDRMLDGRVDKAQQEADLERLEDLMVEAGQKPGEADLVVALQGFEGPIDLLLNLARDQKVDLGRISILALAEQYLSFIASARKLRLEVAADYLVMAAWLAYLKSRLLLPEPPKDEPDATQMADALKYQLLRLEAMQKAAAALQDLPQLGRDVFLRGMPPSLEVEEKPNYYLPLYDLLAALAGPLRRKKPETYSIRQTRLYGLEESMKRLRHILGGPDWTILTTFLPALTSEEKLEARSAVASTFAASLELVKMGELELRQDGTFAPIYLRRRTAQDETLDQEDTTS